jgi:hypothetical protein
VGQRRQGDPLSGFAQPFGVQRHPGSLFDGCEHGRAPVAAGVLVVRSCLEHIRKVRVENVRFGAAAFVRPGPLKRGQHRPVCGEPETVVEIDIPVGAVHVGAVTEHTQHLGPRPLVAVDLQHPHRRAELTEIEGAVGTRIDLSGVEQFSAYPARVAAKAAHHLSHIDGFRHWLDHGPTGRCPQPTETVVGDEPPIAGCGLTRHRRQLYDPG